MRGNSTARSMCRQKRNADLVSSDLVKRFIVGSSLNSRRFSFVEVFFRHLLMLDVNISMFRYYVVW